MTLIELDESAEPAIVAALSEHDWDVVVIGGGIRKPEPLLPLFEQVVNLVHRHAPKAAIAFNTSGGDSVEAAKRVAVSQSAATVISGPGGRVIPQPPVVVGGYLADGYLVPTVRSVASTSARVTVTTSLTRTCSCGPCARRTSPGPYCSVGMPAPEYRRRSLP